MNFFGEKETRTHKRRGNTTTAIRAEIECLVLSPSTTKQVKGDGACEEEELLKKEKYKLGRGIDLALEGAEGDGAVHSNAQTTNN